MNSHEPRLDGIDANNTENSVPDLTQSHIAGSLIRAKVVFVARSRLENGYWCHDKNRQLGEGDIKASYSADLIGLKSRIRNPFKLKGMSFVSVGVDFQSQSEEAYKVVPASDFHGITMKYSQLPGSERNEKGFYHGVVVSHGKREFVLVGPPILIRASEETRAFQTELFES